MEVIVAIISIIITIIVSIMGWNEIKKCIPLLPKPLMVVDYTESSNGVYVQFINIGNAPAEYFTADIKAVHDTFSIGRVNDSEFNMTTSGLGGSMTIISDRNILPQQKGGVYLVFGNRSKELEDPIVKSDNKYKFLGTLKVTVSPMEERGNTES